MTKELTPTQVEELKQALKDKNNAPHHRKIQALILYSECHNLTSVAKSVGFVHQTVRNLLNRYLSGGILPVFSQYARTFLRKSNEYAINTLYHKMYCSCFILLYYPRFGFKPASTWGIKAPFDVPDEAFMALELEDGSLEDISGTVVYSKEFSE
ncbi:hypothetical protein [Streptococcus sp. FT1-106]|uniref:hypothetical protein n=1 Tax=Streptococcus sp. FT1-106 TaxID=3409994 RepID=UPI003BF53296